MLVLRVARVEGPAHGAGHYVETTDHATWHIGLDVVSHATANHHRGTCHQRCRRQLVVGVGHIAQAGLEINLAIAAEIRAELAGVGIYRDQACIDGIGQQATLARRARGNGDGCGRGAAIGGCCDWGAGIKVRQATATLPDGGLGIDVVLPQLFAGVGIQCDQVVVRRTDKHFVAHLQRGHLVFGTVAIADSDVTGLVGPGRYQLRHVAAVDLVQCSKTAATFVIAVVCPVFLGLGRVDLGQAWAVTGGGDRSVRLEHAPETGSDGHGQYRAQRITAVAAQAIGLAQCRVSQRHDQAEHGQSKQTRHQRPENQPCIDQRPDKTGDHHGREQPGTRQAALEQQHGRGQHAQACDQEVQAATERGEVTTTGDKEQSEDQHTESCDPDGPTAYGCRRLRLIHGA